MATATSSEAPLTQILYRTQPGWRMSSQTDRGRVSDPSEMIPCIDHDFVMSPDGTLVASVIENCIEIYDTTTLELIFTIEHERVRNVYFSPLNTYIFTYHRRLSSDGRRGNFVGWQLYEPCETQNSRSGMLPPRNFINPERQPVEVLRFIIKDFDSHNPPVSFSGDERIACRAIRDGVIVMHGTNLSHHIVKETIEGVGSVSVAPTFNKSPMNLSVFTPIRKGRPANVSIYSLNKNRLFRGATRSFYDVDTVKFLWNNRGDCVLVFASSDVDTSGQSYYGSNSLYLFHTDDNLTAQIPVARNGKLQDAAWHPDSREFVMVDDHPMKLTAYDWKGGHKHNFGASARNMVRFSPRGRYLWAGGFGNLNGEMDFWEYHSRQHLGYAEDESCRYFSWSPDGRTFITARTYPLRTVDNGYRVYKYNGEKLLDVPFERLYQIAYRPHITHRPTWQDRRVFGVQERSPSPGVIRIATRTAAQPKVKKSYVPPHMRGRVGADSRGGRGRGRGRGGRGGSQTKRQKYVVGLGYVDVPDSSLSTLSLSERSRDNAHNSNRNATVPQQSGASSGAKNKRNRRRQRGDEKDEDGVANPSEQPRRSSYNRVQKLQQEDDTTFWPRGEKFGVVGKTEGTKKKRKRKRKRKNASDSAVPVASADANPTDAAPAADDAGNPAADAPAADASSASANSGSLPLPAEPSGLAAE